jgi:signal transduction histidine kinase
MFTKLRNRFLLLNLSITSGIMILAFGIVYYITSSNLEEDIRQQLQAPPEAQVRMAAVPGGAGLPAETGEFRHAIRNVYMGGTGTFHAEVDGNGQILRIESGVHLPEESYQKLVEIAWKNQDEQEVIKQDNRQWRYIVSPIRLQVVGENGAPPAVERQNYSIRFLDVTEMNRALAQLIMALVLVGIGTLFGISAVSLYFANRAIRPIRHAWEKQKQFVADASHELKTPISVIHANCDALAASRQDTVQNQMKWIENIRGGADRMARLVHDLLILARTDDDQASPHFARFNFSEVVESAVRSMEAAATGKNLAFTRTVEPGLMTIGDPDGIRQVVEILLDNAVKYANPDGWIALSLARAGRRIDFSISNSGPGIAKEDLPRVFDRFFRADRSRTHEDGSYGLGLAIAQSIVRRHGSEIRVRSVENVSTTFSFSLQEARTLREEPA